MFLEIMRNFVSLKKSQDLEPQPALREYIESIEKLSNMFEKVIFDKINLNSQRKVNPAQLMSHDIKRII